MELCAHSTGTRSTKGEKGHELCHSAGCNCRYVLGEEGWAQLGGPSPRVYQGGSENYVGCSEQWYQPAATSTVMNRRMHVLARVTGCLGAGIFCTLEYLSVFLMKHSL